ncbi:MAG TPA: hypothetical protein PK544_08990 [Spirochaetota bacterium]|nr:hypothetical protein [Spirochaetota bacterium]HPJ36920.1 hypothetical protein [Spirochaetota bacterium]HPQ53270.1 hypothetical protein [Spirochaetota bacterium]
MRSKQTNFLQGVILLAAIIYILNGALYYFSPLSFCWVFNLDISEEWLNVIPTNEFFFLVFTISRAFAALLFSIGISMVLPLFDPLRYRGLVYYSGVLFPFLASVIFLFASIKNMSVPIIILGFTYFTIFALTLTAMLITRKSAQSGIE